MTKLDADEVAESHDVPDLVAFMLGTGCRIGEAIALRAEAVDLDARTVTVAANLVRVRGEGLTRHDGKTFAARRVLPLPAFLVALLEERGLKSAGPEEIVFPNNKGGWRDLHNTGARIRDALQRAGYGWASSHVFRKTAITVLDRAGLSARAIAGGHSRPSITLDVYMDKRPRGARRRTPSTTRWVPCARA